MAQISEDVKVQNFIVMRYRWEIVWIQCFNKFGNIRLQTNNYVSLACNDRIIIVSNLVRQTVTYITTEKWKSHVAPKIHSHWTLWTTHTEKRICLLFSTQYKNIKSVENLFHFVCIFDKSLTANSFIQFILTFCPYYA